MRTTRPRRTTVAPDDLSTLLPDWSRHLRAMNRGPSTIASYQAVGAHFLAYLEQRGMPRTASGITREHVESYIAQSIPDSALMETPPEGWEPQIIGRVGQASGAEP